LSSAVEKDAVQCVCPLDEDASAFGVGHPASIRVTKPPGASAMSAKPANAAAFCPASFRRASIRPVVEQDFDAIRSSMKGGVDRAKGSGSFDSIDQ
jgi:hypothetical protein